MRIGVLQVLQQALFLEQRIVGFDPVDLADYAAELAAAEAAKVEAAPQDPNSGETEE